MKGVGFRVLGQGCRVLGLGFRVKGYRGKDVEFSVADNQFCQLGGV
jgi:hypothetical protein